MEGVVIKSTGSWYTVRSSNNQLFECRLKGKFRYLDIKNTNPISVGDFVVIQIENDKQAMIVELKPRTNYIIRKSTNLSKQNHIIASNMDQLLLVVTLVAPQTTLAFIDRYIATAEAYKINPILVFNKFDLYTDEILDFLYDIQNIYQSIGYQTIICSAITGQGLKELKEILKNKTTLLSGHSGVGKSTLINALEPGLNLKTGKVSEAHFKGMHTTTFAEMHFFSFGGSIIDTPGIKSFALSDMQQDELSHYFIEIFKFSSSCKYYNCKHINEPDCAVKKAVESGKIAESRYQNYVSMYLDEGTKYR